MNMMPLALFLSYLYLPGWYTQLLISCLFQQQQILLMLIFCSRFFSQKFSKNKPPSVVDVFAVDVYNDHVS